MTKEQNDPICYTIKPCRFGKVLVAQNKQGVCAVYLGNDDQQLLNELTQHYPSIALINDTNSLSEVVSQVIDYIAHPAGEFKLPLALQGTPFQRKVWNALQKIPAGTTKTYTELAQLIGHPRSTRAVANACAANQLAVIIPCHRIVRSDGNISGYRWSAERKQALLLNEQQTQTG